MSLQISQRASNFEAATRGNCPLDVEATEKIVADYPYFIPAILELLNAADSEAERRRLTTMGAVPIADRQALYDRLGPDAARLSYFYPEETKENQSTIDTISHFLDTFDNDDDAETHALEQLIFNPVPDYAQILAKEEEQSTPDDDELEGDNLSEQDLLINKFIAKSKQQAGRFPSENAQTEPEAVADEAPVPKAPQADADSSLLSESLAKIYIKKHRYDKALEIILSLSLNFPEKSIYFADQIRFLRKLIVLEKYKQKNK